MGKNKEHQVYARELSECLKSGDLSELNFDHLRNWLKEMTAVLAESERLQEEVDLLRRDCTARIAGMAKAIAVADRRSDSLQAALDFIEGLAELSAAELLEQYNRTQIRFRDSFPASFRPSGRRDTFRQNDIALYK